MIGEVSSDAISRAVAEWTDSVKSIILEGRFWIIPCFSKPALWPKGLCIKKVSLGSIGCEVVHANDSLDQH